MNDHCDPYFIHFYVFLSSCVYTGVAMVYCTCGPSTVYSTYGWHSVFIINLNDHCSTQANGHSQGPERASVIIRAISQCASAWSYFTISGH